MFQKLNKVKASWLSKLGLGLSYLCVIHCITTPIFIALLPVVSAKVFEHHALEMFLLGSSFLAVGGVNIVGFVRHHKKWAPIVYMLLGFSLIISGHFSNVYFAEIALSVLGGVFLLISVLTNNKSVHLSSTNAHSSCSH